MSITILPLEIQSTGQFNGGAIMENKPVVPGGNGKSFYPFSNLFYWAHAWSDNGSTIGEHPHQGFEILSFVLKGNIDHYDNMNRQWIPLKEGDVQIIRAGKGISHAERLNEGSRIFQIWFDPNLEKSMSQAASYDDYPSDSFPIKNENGITIKTFKGDNSPLKMETEGVVISELIFEAGEHKITANNKNFYLGYLLEGSIETEGKPLKEGDCYLIKDESSFALKTDKTSKVFMIELLSRPAYTTYAEAHGMK